MARKTSGGRREPIFAGKASLDGLRLNRTDRVGDNSDFEDEDEDEPSVRSRREKPEPRERKASTSKASKRRSSKVPFRKRFGRIAYWGAVLGLWAMIAAGG